MVLVLIAMKGFADYYQESGIFNNALYGIIARARVYFCDQS